MSSSDLVVNFVYKDLRVNDGFQIFPIDQVKVSFKGMWTCKKEGIFMLVAKQGKL